MSTSPYPQDSLQRLQAIERDIVAVIDKICRENDIEYFIDGGTCLGAAVSYTHLTLPTIRLV